MLVNALPPHHFKFQVKVAYMSKFICDLIKFLSPISKSLKIGVEGMAYNNTTNFKVTFRNYIVSFSGLEFFII